MRKASVRLFVILLLISTLRPRKKILFLTLFAL